MTSQEKSEAIIMTLQRLEDLIPTTNIMSLPDNVCWPNVFRDSDVSSRIQPAKSLRKDAAG